MNEPRQEPAGGCPSADALLRCTQGYATEREKQLVQDHLKVCPRCNSDYKSIANLDLELLVADRDREELLENYRPAPLCHELTSRRLAAINRSPRPPSRPDIRQHLDRCAFCRQRLLLAGPADEQTLRDRIISATLQPALARAHEVLLAAVWVPAVGGVGLIRQLTAWLDRAGAVILDGLEPRQVVPAYAMGGAMGGPAGTPLEPDSVSLQRWEFPLPEQGGTLILSANPIEGGERWHVKVAVEVPDSAVFPTEDDRIEVVQNTGRITVADLLRNWLGMPIEVEAGLCHLVLTIGGNIRRLDMVLGPRAADEEAARP
jgi:hypothetical protein